MVVDRKSWPWVLSAGVVVAAAAAWYVDYANGPTRVSGGSWPGFAFAVAGSAIIVFCMLLSIRKALRTAPLGPARHWMQAHVWFGLISYPLIWFHAAFRVGGTLTTVLMILFTVVWLSGIVGLVLQHTIPRVLTTRVPHATIHEQITHHIDQMRREAETIVAAATVQASVGVAAAPAGLDLAARESAALDAAAVGLFRQFHADRVVPALADSSARIARLGGPSLAAAISDLRTQLPQRLQAPLSELEQVVRQRLQLERQRRLHRLLHNWLLIHVPLAYALLTLSVIHAVAALKFRGIG